MQKRSYILLLMVAFIFAQCSKKTADQVMTTTEEVVQEVKEVKDPALAWRSAAPSPAPAKPIQLGEYKAFTLDNGLEVIVVENHKLPRVSYQLTLNNKPLIEGDQAGYVSMAGDMMATGTKTKSKAEIDEAIDFIGANMNTSATGMFASSLKKHGDKLLEIVSDVLYNPSFPQEEFEKLKKQTLSGLESNKTDPNSMAANVVAAVNYGKGHPYGEVVTDKSVQNISLGKCKEYYNTYFKPNNAYLIIVGDIDEAEAKMKAEKYFGSWERGNVPTMKYDVPKGPSETKVAIANKDGAVQSVIRITYPVQLEPGADDLVKARVMNNILGGGIFSGRLMQNLREDKAYTYGARSQLSSDDLVGNFNASASVRNAVTDSSITEFMYELRRLRDEPISADDLSLVKSSMGGSFARSLESPQTIARFALNTFRYDLPKNYYSSYLQRLDAVTIADVQEMAQKYIRPDAANIVVVGSADDIADKLVQFDADGEIDFYDSFGNKVERSEAEVPAGVDGKSVIGGYLGAIGGLDKIQTVKSMKKEMKMALMGQEATMVEMHKAPNMYYSKMEMSGMVMQEQKYDGTKAMAGQMGQNEVVSEGPAYDAVVASAAMISQTKYLTDDYALEVKGIEDVDGTKAYKVQVTNPGGEKQYEYYAVATSLLLRAVSTQEGPDGSSNTITTDYADYKEVGGLTLPHTMTMTGVMPVPLKMEVTSIEVDGDIPAATFTVE